MVIPVIGSVAVRTVFFGGIFLIEAFSALTRSEHLTFQFTGEDWSVEVIFKITFHLQLVYVR